MTAPGTQPLLIEEVAKRTGLPVSTLRYWRTRNRGEGPPMFRLGRRIVADPADVQKWIDEQRAKGANPAA